MSGSPPTSPASQFALSRRQMTMGALAAGGAQVTWPATATAQTAPARVKDWLLGPDARPIMVPRDYLGLHHGNGVSSKAAPQPTYGFDALRSHDVDDPSEMPATQWSEIEISPGLYDWRHVDIWMRNNPDKTRIWVLFGTPKFYQKYPDEPFVYPALRGGSSPPKDPATAANFIKALLARYPGRFKFVEIWNEPNFGGGTNPLRDRWKPNTDDPAWFSGTASDLAQMARHVRAVLPQDVKLLAAGWVWVAQPSQIGPGNPILQFAAAPDGAGGKGRDHVQALSVHLYTYHFNVNAMIEEIRSYERLFAKAGFAPELPRLTTETGAWNEGGKPLTGKFTKDNPPLADKIRIVKRWCMIPAAMGYQGNYLYQHSDLGSLGDPANVPEIAAAIGEMRDGLSGKTLVRAALLEDDTIWLAFSDGTNLRA